MNASQRARAAGYMRAEVLDIDLIGSEGAAAPVCLQNRAYGSVHGSSRKAYPLIYLKPKRSTGLGDLHLRTGEVFVSQ
jgi:hypothetical protein